MPKIVHIGLDSDGKHFALRTPFDKNFVEAIRNGPIPSKKRNWDPDKQAWMVDREYYGEAEALIKRFYGDDVVILSSQPAQVVALDEMLASMKDPVMEDYQVLGVRPEAELFVLHAAYCAMETFYFAHHYMNRIGGDKGDKHLEGIPTWITSAVLGAPANPAISRNRMRVAYLRICQHREVEPVIPPMVAEQFTGDLTPAAVMASFDLIAAIKGIR